ncbi:dna double-strand break repair rad50 ATPase [Schistosoma japonicum]|nr:dna double-strand break repair rad50 ATPase [Schistosoma japonicum]
MNYIRTFIDQMNTLYTNEKNIYTHGCRLNTVEIENERINKGITKQEESIQNICSEWEKILRLKSKLKNQYQSITDTITNNENLENQFIHSSIEFYKYLITIKLQIINKQSIERNQLFNQFLPELITKFNEINQYFLFKKKLFNNQLNRMNNKLNTN